MEQLTTWTLELAVIDWVTIGLLLVGFFVGLNRGLGYAFGTLLWLVAAMWMARGLSPKLLSWMPNTTEPENIHARFMAYGALASAILSIPLMLRVLGNPFRGGKSSKKKSETESYNKHMGSLVGVLNSILFATLMMPYVHRFDVIAASYDYALFPAMAANVADNVTFLYPEAFRSQLHKTIGPVGRSEVLNLRHLVPMPVPVDSEAEPPGEIDDSPAPDPR